MSKLNKKVEYALMVLKYFKELELKGKGLIPVPKGAIIHQMASATEIAAAIHSPAEVTARVLQNLSSHGILKAEYGLHGGYKLAKDLSKISVHDLMSVIEGEGSTELAKCLTDKECDLLKNCTIVTPIENLNKKVQSFFKSISIEEVIHGI